VGRFADDPGAVLDGFSDAIVVVDDRLVITSANVAAANLVGAASPDDLVGHSGIEWVHEPDRIDAVERLALLASRSQPSPVSLRIARVDGALIWVEITGALVSAPGRKPAIALGLRNVDWRHAADLDAARVVHRSHVLVSNALHLQATNPSNLSGVLDAVVDGIGSVVAASVVMIHEVDADGSTLTLRARWLHPSATAGERPTPPPSSVPLDRIPNWINALNSGRRSIELGSDTHGIQAELHRVDPALVDGYTFAFLPGERLLGALTVGFADRPHLSSDEHDLLEQSARSISVALQRVRNQQALAESEAMFRDLFEGSSAIMYLVDPVTLRLVDANEAATKFYGYPRDSMTGMNLHELTFHTRAELAEVVDRVRAGGTTVIDERQRLAGGEERVVEIHSTPMRLGSRILDLAIVQDVTEARRAVAHLERLASIDDLTGAYNRRRFAELVREEIDRAERYGHPFCVLMLDLDHFKAVNDQFGHLAGDSLLQAFGDEVSALLRASDRLGRMGGEEFAILLPETTLDDAAAMAERIRAATEVLTVAGIEAPPCTVSIGGTAWQPGDTSDDLFARSDRKLYLAKQAGRNRFEA
jgi:diguanylate cyclase (GGDEF)-like protein/PAS domain S-box-containing protein